MSDTSSDNIMDSANKDTQNDTERKEDKADDIKEPEEENHKEECHLINGPPAPEQNGDVKTEEDGQKEKGELEEAESNKEESEGWLYILGHNLLKKKVLKEGTDVTSRPTNGQVVSLRYSGKVLGTEEVVDKEDKHTFTLGDGDVIMAFDLCVALMTPGEICELVTDAKYAYGTAGKSSGIPASASLHYELELLSVEAPLDPAKMSPEDRAALANSKRERGNTLYAMGEFGSAINSYTKGVQVVDAKYDVGVTEKTQLDLLKDTRMKCYNNLAAAQLKIDAWDAAIKSTNKVLLLEPENVKALFRKGKCLAGKGDMSKAISTLRKALELEPETKIIHQELSRLVAKQKKAEESQRQMYERMIGEDKVKEKQQIQQQSKMSRSKLLAIGGATAAAFVSVGLGVYRYLHL